LKRFRWLTTAAPLLLVPALAVGQLIPTPARHLQDLVMEAPTPDSLRARLQRLVAAESRDTVTAGRALYYIGLSHERAGAADSAIAAYERAVDLWMDILHVDALADALLLRNRPGDPDRALRALEGRASLPRWTSQWNFADIQGRQAWALFLKGQADSAAALFRKAESQLIHPDNPLRRDWRYRMGVVMLDRKDLTRAYELLEPLAVESRGTDSDVMGMLRDLASQSGGAVQLTPRLNEELVRMAEEERAVLVELGAHRVAIVADDGFPLGAVVFPPRDGKARRAVVGLVNHDDTFESWDSLAVGLGRSGYALILLELRGANRSVARTAPMPESWRGREVEMENRVAQDVGHALRALASEVAVDTTRYLMAASGPAVSIAAAAAARDPRARVLLFMSSDPSPVERGVTRARLASIRRPVFFQLAPEDHVIQFVTEGLYRAVDERVARIAESERIGRGPRIFRMDPEALPRLKRWLDETWPGPDAKRGPRPATPRKG
jgi:tetratricopeptide (TPR) repeat protein